jgi:murein DD-endopeptidase MepM/ murein hydrolase activator NlpD
MRRYEDWEEDHPGGTPEEFFAVMLQTQGFGKKTAPGGAKTTSLPAGGVTYTPKSTRVLNKPGGSAGAILTKFRGGAGGDTGRTVAAPKSGASASMTGGQPGRIMQPYGMTPFASTQLGGMYAYTDQYTKDGSHVGHMGVDVDVADGTALYAPVSGTVVQAGGVPWEQDYRYGSTPQTGGLRIELPNGDIVVMGHMQEITVSVGDTVTAGQPVGYSGQSTPDTADPGSGPHVHVEYRKYAPGQTSSDYLALDPRDVLDL